MVKEKSCVTETAFSGSARVSPQKAVATSGTVTEIYDSPACKGRVIFMHHITTIPLSCYQYLPVHCQALSLETA